MEFIVQLFRALANHERIRMLRMLTVFREMIVSNIAEATKAGLPIVSAHLKVLAAAGLVWRRRSGRYVGYRLAERAGNPVTAIALRTIREAFRSVAHDKPRSVAIADQPDSSAASDAALFACFTAFTHPRRLQIIDLLCRQDAAAVAELTRVLSMSRRACHRHLEKLERRGIVAHATEGHGTVYALTEGEGPLQQGILLAACDYLRGLHDDGTLREVRHHPASGTEA